VRSAERLASLLAAVGAAERAAEIGQGVGELEACRRPLQYVHGFAQVLESTLATFERAEVTKRAAEAASSAPRARLRNVLAA
jgi:hypothetical protein